MRCPLDVRLDKKKFYKDSVYEDIKKIIYKN